MERYVMPILFTIVPIALIAIAGSLSARRASARPLVRTAWGILYTTAAFLALILVGELFTDAGTLTAATLLTPWLITLAALTILAVLRPRISLAVLAVLALLPIGIATWEAFDPLGASTWADAIGPVELVLIYVLAVVTGIAARKAPREAGWVLLLTAGVPIILRLLTPGGEFARQAIIASLSVPAAAAGVAFVLASRVAPRTPHSDRTATRMQPG